VAPTASDDWTAGDYTLLGWVTKATDRVTLDPGRITVLPNLAAVTAAGYDSRSQAKQMLDAIDARLNDPAQRAAPTAPGAPSRRDRAGQVPAGGSLQTP
jgi:hypothetical protein